MIGIIVQLAISWLIIWLAERKDLSVLGFMPSRTRLRQFLTFFLITAACYTTEIIMKTYFSGSQWRINPHLTSRLITEGIWWNICSVLYEELIFRGVLLYLLIKRLGTYYGIIISAIAFGIYHWFSSGVLGQPVQMIIIFIMTGAMGLLLAYAYTKTLSLYVPVAIHLGWNLLQQFVFSQGVIGNGIFIQSPSVPFRTNSYLIFFVVTCLPILLVFALNLLILKQVKKPKCSIVLVPPKEVKACPPKAGGEACHFRHPPSDLGLLTSNLGPLTSDL